MTVVRFLAMLGIYIGFTATAKTRSAWLESSSTVDIALAFTASVMGAAVPSSVRKVVR